MQVKQLSVDSALHSRSPRRLFGRQPLVIDFNTTSSSDNTSVVDKLRTLFATTPLSILQRPLSLTNASLHGEFVDLSLDEFFDNPIYKNTSKGIDCIVLSSIKNRPDIIKQLLPEQATLFLPQIEEIRLWINFAHAFTGVHFDGGDNFNLQLSGEKRFVFYPSGFRHYRKRSLFTGAGHTSMFTDFDKVDLKQYPDFVKRRQQRCEVTLKPGQMIYIPTGCWHQTYTDDATSINLLVSCFNRAYLKHPYVLVDNLYKALLKKLGYKIIGIKKR
ncbi:MAG: cupin-like domain-containing protein [Pseudomonadota bacterium]